MGDTWVWGAFAKKPTKKLIANGQFDESGHHLYLGCETFAEPRVSAAFTRCDKFQSASHSRKLVGPTLSWSVLEAVFHIY
jgi:hypothetical protein